MTISKRGIQALLPRGNDQKLFGLGLEPKRGGAFGNGILRHAQYNGDSSFSTKITYPPQVVYKFSHINLEKVANTDA